MAKLTLPPFVRKYRWPLLVIPILFFALFSATIASYLLFGALLAFCALFTFFHYRFHVPIDVTPTTFCLLVIGYYYGPLAVIVFFIFGSFIPGILAGSGIGPASFVYIPLNVGLGMLFPAFASTNIVASLVVALIGYAFLVFFIDGFFFSSYARSIVMAAGFLAGSLIYVAFFWRLGSILGLLR